MDFCNILQIISQEFTKGTKSMSCFLYMIKEGLFKQWLIIGRFPFLESLCVNI